MLIKEYISYDAHALASLIKNKEVSPEEVLHCALTRINEVNPALNAIVTDCADFAKKTLLNMRGDEPFYGVPLLVKDLGHALEGIRMTEGSGFFAGNVAKMTSDLVKKLITLGFVPVAKTNAPELGLSYVTESSLFGPCRNPFDTARTAGGSSGGSAAAIAAGIAPVATASDGGGSIRIPAACCGLFGFKPTRGVMPTGPWVEELWSGLASNFILARSIRDNVALFKKLASKTLIAAPIEVKKNLTITYLEGVFPSVPIAPACLEAIEVAKDLLKQKGHKIKKEQLELDLEGIGNSALTLIAANTCAVIKLQEKELGRKAKLEELEPITWEFYYRGKSLSAHEYIAARNKLYQLLRPFHEFLQQRDMVLTPALAQLPLLIGELKTSEEFNKYLEKNIEFSPFTSLFNQAGAPAMTLPVMFYENKLPVSVQIGAEKGNDLLLLSLASQLEDVLPKINTPKIS